jgi:hypothetical protein
MAGMIVFDIETMPLPEDRLRAIYKPPAMDAKTTAALADFDPATVRYGVMKDEAKGAAKLKDCQEKHAAGQAAAQVKWDERLAEHWQEFVDKAALSALTGSVLAIGYKSATKAWIQSADGDEDREAEILSDFWRGFVACHDKQLWLLGHNSFEFDLPFLVQRCWILGVTVPACVTVTGGRYWHSVFRDTMQHWRLAKRGLDYVGLDTLGRAFGVGGKPDDCTGADFHRLWMSGNEAKRKAAEGYLRQDLELTWAVAQRMGIA